MWGLYYDTSKLKFYMLGNNCISFNYVVFV